MRDASTSRRNVLLVMDVQRGVVACPTSRGMTGRIMVARAVIVTVGVELPARR